MPAFPRFILILISILVSGFASASEWRFDNVDRVVALSDIHGAFDPMVRTLQNADVLDEAKSWSGGATHLVIVGDLLDRGPDSRKVMDLLMRVEAEADTAGGRVHVLIGNHEAMNLIGDLRYVSKQEYAAFAGEETNEEREQGFVAWAARMAENAESPDALRARFEADHPPGFFAHRRAFESDGHYGKWLLTKPLMVVVNGTAFVHGGLSPLVAEVGLDGINDTLRGELVSYVRHFDRLQTEGVLLPGDSFYDHESIAAAHMPDLDSDAETLAAIEAVQVLDDSFVHSSDGPLWYRGNVYCSPMIEDTRIDAALAAIGAQRVVIGHTPTLERRILERLDGRVIEVDTGMLSGYYKGRGQALVLEGDATYVISEESREQLALTQHPRRVGARPGGFMRSTELEQLLEQGSISNLREDEVGRTLVTVSDGERSVEAMFTRREGRGFFADVAAYRLDVLLGLSAVPVAVVREVDGRAGSLQFLPARWIDEKQRSEAGVGGGANCPLDLQWQTMYVFDILLYNRGRTRNRMLYSTDTWQLLLVGHTDAFPTWDGRPEHLRQLRPVLEGEWRESLQALDGAMIEEAMGDVLDRRRQRALLTRRDELLATDY